MEKYPNPRATEGESIYIYLYPGKHLYLAQWYTDNSSGSLKKQEEICFIAFCVCSVYRK